MIRLQKGHVSAQEWMETSDERRNGAGWDIYNGKITVQKGWMANMNGGKGVNIVGQT